MLQSCKSGDSKSTWKVLIMDKLIVKIMSYACKMPDITDEGVSLVEDIYIGEGSRCPPWMLYTLCNRPKRNCVNGINAQRVYGYALYKDGKSTNLPYPLEDFHLDVAGRSFHHGRYIQRMREKTASLPNVRLEQGTVTYLVEEKGTVKGVQYKSKGSDPD